MNVEEQEQAMDYAFRLSDHLHKGDLYDSVQDARSEARYDGPDERERLFAQRWSWDEWNDWHQLHVTRFVGPGGEGEPDDRARWQITR